MLNHPKFLAVAALSTLPMLVQADMTQGPYMAGSLGYGGYKLDEVRDDDGDTEGTFYDESGVSYGVYFGYALYTNIAFELGYENLVNTDDSPYEGFKREAEVIATTLAMKVNLPINSGWGLFLSLGYGNYDAEYTLTEEAEATEKLGEKSDGYFYGLGVSYDLFDKMKAALSYEQHRFDDDTWEGGDVEADISEVSLNLSYHF